MLDTSIAEQSKLVTRTLSALGRIFRGSKPLSYDEEQPVSIEYLGRIPTNSSFDPPEDIIFIVHFEDKGVLPENNERAVISYGDVKSEDEYERRIFLKSFDRATWKCEVYRSGEEDKAEEIVPLWLQKKIDEAEDEHWRKLIEKGRLLRLERAAAATPKNN